MSTVFLTTLQKGLATNIDRYVAERFLIKLINQKITSNRKIISGYDSFYRSEKSANNSDIIENSSKNQTNLDASQVSLKDPVLCRMSAVSIAIKKNYF